MALLQVENLYKNFDRLEVLKGISFTMEEGETLSVIGPSGGGKTTLLRCLNFLEMPTGGSITVKGEEIFSGDKPIDLEEIRKNRLRFGLVFQSFNLFPQYTALQNVTLAPKLHAKDRQDYKNRKKEILAEIEEEGKELLGKVGLSDKLHCYPHQLSGGQQQRVAIARALALKPEVLFFDEPTSALDPELTDEVLRVIKQLARQKMTMLIVTHEMSFAEAVSDRVLFIEGGSIVEQGRPAEVMRNPKEERTKKFLSGYNI